MSVLPRVILAVALAFTSGAMSEVANFKVEGDGIPQSLTGKPGDAARGRALLAKRGAANCLTCHSIKDKDLQPGGTSAPALDGVGAALTVAQLRLSVVDYARITRGTAMPSFHRSGMLGGSGPTLSAAEVEDVVAYLSTLKK
jgi:L-cysteine S-thiosulfotransferase